MANPHRLSRFVKSIVRCFDLKLGDCLLCGLHKTVGVLAQQCLTQSPSDQFSCSSADSVISEGDKTSSQPLQSCLSEKTTDSVIIDFLPEFEKKINLKCVFRCSLDVLPLASHVVELEAN